MRIAGVFRAWTTHFENCLREAQQKGEISRDMTPEELAEFLLSGFEGSLLISKVMKSPEPLRNFIQVFFTRVAV